MKIWLDGELVDESAAKVSVFDHGLLYGDGVFEGIRFYNRRVFRLEEHIKRDPIIVLRTQLQQEGELTDDEFAKMDEELKAIVQDAWDFADQSPEPPVEALFEDVLVDTTSDTPAEAAVAAD